MLASFCFFLVVLSLPWKLVVSDGMQLLAQNNYNTLVGNKLEWNQGVHTSPLFIVLIITTTTKKELVQKSFYIIS